MCIDNLDRELLKRVEQDLFPAKTPIVCKPDIEGQTVESGQFVIGAWAGTESSINNIFHEMCHFAVFINLSLKKTWKKKRPSATYLCNQTEKPCTKDLL